MLNKRESSLKSHLNKEFLLSNRLKKNLSLRKIQVEEYIEKKRFNIDRKVNEMEVDNSCNNNKTQPDDSRNSSKCLISSFYDSLLYLKFDKRNINDYVLSLNSKDFNSQLTGIVAIRKILSEPLDPPIEQVIISGSITQLFKIVKTIEDERAICEIVWIFTNIASCEHEFTKYLYLNGIIDIISDLIAKTNPEYVKDQLIWLISNIAGDHEAYCSEMRNKNFHEFVLEVLMDESLSKIHKNCLWALSNLLRGAKTFQITQTISNLIIMCCKIINSYLNHSNYAHVKLERIEEVIPNVLSILACLTEHNSCLLGILIKFNTAAHLIQMLNYVKCDKMCFLSVLRILGNFSANEHIYTTEIVEHDILSNLKMLLEESNSPQITREICWILSNIAAGLEEHVDLFFKTEGLLDNLFRILKDENIEVKKEALWCISNLTSTKIFIHMNRLVEHGIIKIFNEWLSFHDYRMPALIIEALENILNCYIQKDYSRRKIFTLCENFGIISKLEQLSNIKNECLNEKSEQILDKYFLHYREEDQDDLEFEDNKQELLFCSGNEATEESEDIVPLINSLEKEKNKENYPTYDESAKLNDSNTIDYSQFLWA